MELNMLFLKLIFYYNFDRFQIELCYGEPKHHQALLNK